MGFTLHIYEIIWKERFVSKLESKHKVTIDEVEQVLFSRAHFRRAKKGRIRGEDLYVAYGQTDAGRYLVVFFIHKWKKAALVISARDMSTSERRYYEQKK